MICLPGFLIERFLFDTELFVKNKSSYFNTQYVVSRHNMHSSVPFNAELVHKGCCRMLTYSDVLIQIIYVAP